MQSQNLGSLYLFDVASLIYVLVNDFAFLLAIFAQVFCLKVMQRRQGKFGSFFPNNLLFWRLWKVLLVSQLGYCAVLILIIWNYNEKFFMPLQLYSIYSAFVCLKAVINSQIEKTLAFIILVLAKVFQQILCHTLQPVLLAKFANTTTTNVSIG